MVQTEFYRQREDGVNLYKTYSTTGMMIRQDQTGAEYADAIDVENSGYTYTETDTPIDDEISDTEALNIIMGRENKEEEPEEPEMPEENESPEPPGTPSVPENIGGGENNETI